MGRDNTTVGHIGMENGNGKWEWEFIKNYNGNKEWNMGMEYGIWNMGMEMEMVH